MTEANVANPQSSTVMVTVNINDMNDNRPVFPVTAPNYYSVEIDEGEGRRKVVQVRATDVDSGFFGSIRLVSKPYTICKPFLNPNTNVRSEICNAFFFIQILIEKRF